MQTMLNKMVSTVRRGMIDPEDASRAIHECAALLGLQLANQLPGTTIIVSGMQKTTSTSDVFLAFKDFGPIDSIAVASKQRGFGKFFHRAMESYCMLCLSSQAFFLPFSCLGIVRFKNQSAAAEAMERFRTSEIVIKNVAVTLKSLPPVDGSNL